MESTENVSLFTVKISLRRPP